MAWWARRRSRARPAGAQTTLHGHRRRPESVQGPGPGPFRCRSLGLVSSSLSPYRCTGGTATSGAAATLEFNFVKNLQETNKYLPYVEIFCKKKNIYCYSYILAVILYPIFWRTSWKLYCIAYLRIRESARSSSPRRVLGFISHLVLARTWLLSPCTWVNSLLHDLNFPEWSTPLRCLIICYLYILFHPSKKNNIMRYSTSNFLKFN